MNENTEVSRRKIVAAFAAAGFFSAPLAARAQFSLDLGKIADIGRALKSMTIDEDDELEMGERLFGEMIDLSGGHYRNSIVQRAVADIAEALFGVSERPRFEWEIVVVDSNEVNAWALPGGKIAINKGLLRYTETEDELAAVIAHEIGHAEYSHAAREMKKKAFYTGLSGAAQAAAVAALEDSRVESGLGMGGLQVPMFKLVTSGYSRDFEFEADAHILKTFRKMNLNTQAGLKIFETLMAIAPRKSKRRTSLFSGHPETEKRLKVLRENPFEEGAVAAPPSEAFVAVKTSFPTRRYYMVTRRRGP